MIAIWRMILFGIQVSASIATVFFWWFWKNAKEEKRLIAG